MDFVTGLLRLAVAIAIAFVAGKLFPNSNSLRSWLADSRGCASVRTR